VARCCGTDAVNETGTGVPLLAMIDAKFSGERAMPSASTLGDVTRDGERAMPSASTLGDVTRDEETGAAGRGGPGGDCGVTRGRSPVDGCAGGGGVI
jgi:hypothetical protein